MFINRGLRQSSNFFFFHIEPASAVMSKTTKLVLHVFLKKKKKEKKKKKDIKKNIFFLKKYKNGISTRSKIVFVFNINSYASPRDSSIGWRPRLVKRMSLVRIITPLLMWTRQNIYVCKFRVMLHRKQKCCTHSHSHSLKHIILNITVKITIIYKIQHYIPNSPNIQTPLQCPKQI